MDKADLVLNTVLNVDNDECWPWEGAKTNGGYPRLVVRGRHMLAHRLAYIIRFGRINPNLELGHICHNEWCWNPNHVRPITHEGNMAEAPSKVMTHCTKGHLLEGNVYAWIGKDGNMHRQCRTCHNERSRLNYSKKVLSSIG